ncbi:hypothetical protein HPP92_024433 [Vanilla planifolia]|uniref:SBP-type domain-containing protein n=1 Tax=Vanilla planifolia TaxID=51239 RepID=A0A835PQA2_VANPL|nr:hypothetical protein HPP92_024744 [Vanilla planifolia]KAG0456645.1 hypothetical protein HPP92_024433 [Vanilla planifolia]
MNGDLTSQYIEFVADRLLGALNYSKMYNVLNPLDWMLLISLQRKANYFEKRAILKLSSREKNIPRLSRWLARAAANVPLISSLEVWEIPRRWKNGRRRRRASLAVSSSKRTRAPSRSNQSVDFKSDLSGCRVYHRRQKVCELHSKTPLLMVGGQEQRFCQQYNSRGLLLGKWRETPYVASRRQWAFDGSTHLKRLQGAFFALPVSMESSSPVASVRYSGLRSVGLFLESHFATS